MKLKYFWGFIFLSLMVMGFFIVEPLWKGSYKKSSPILIGICCGEPPYEYLDKEGNVQGINKDLLEQVFKNPSLNKKTFKFSIMPFNQSFLALNKGKIDFLATFLTVTEKRKELYDFAIISQSKIVFINRTNIHQDNVNYGLQLEAVFEEIAKQKKIKYTGYSDFQSVMLHFDMKKIDGIICDINTLKQLIEKNFNDITTLHPVQIQWNDNILIISNKSQEKVTGVLHGDSIKYANGPVRVYKNLKDLILAFRCEEIKQLILKKNEITPEFNQWMGLQIRSNSKNLLFKPYLFLRFKKDHWMMEKNNNKNNLVTGVLKNNFFEGYKSVKYYNNMEFLLNDLMEDKIDGIAIRNLDEISCDVFCGIANINKSMGGFYLNNGFAFRKQPINDFDLNEKQKLIDAIESEAKKNTQLSEYQTNSRDNNH
jgi:polar amino acid transport system substrate-binding protein